MCPSPPSSSIPREPSSCQHDFLEYLKCLLRYSFLSVPKIHQHHRWHCVSRPLLATNKALRTLLRQCFGVLNSRKRIFDVSVTGDADVSAGAYCFRVCGRFSPSLNYVICFTCAPRHFSTSPTVSPTIECMKTPTHSDLQRLVSISSFVPSPHCNRRHG